MTKIIFALALLHTTAAFAGDWAIFKEVPQEELDEISGILDQDCEISAKNVSDHHAQEYAFVARHATDPKSAARMTEEFREGLRADVFKACRKGATHSALQYGAAVNRATKGEQ